MGLGRGYRGLPPLSPAAGVPGKPGQPVVGARRGVRGERRGFPVPLKGLRRRVAGVASRRVGVRRRSAGGTGEGALARAVRPVRSGLGRAPLVGWEREPVRKPRRGARVLNRDSGAVGDTVSWASALPSDVLPLLAAAAFRQWMWDAVRLACGSRLAASDGLLPSESSPEGCLGQGAAWECSYRRLQG